MMKRIISIVLTAALLLTALTVFAEDAEVQSIKIGITSTTMKPGETQKMIISVTPTNANPVLEYESDNPDVVTAAIGTLIANNEGIANITVRVSGTEIQDSVQVTVSNKTPEEEKPGVVTPGGEEDKPDGEIVKVNKITVENRTLYLERYESERIVYSVSPDNATNHNVNFKSSNTSVATVDDRGYVYAKRSGNTTITLESEDGGATASVRVYVSDEYEDDDDYDSTLRSIYITYDDEILANKFEVMETTTVQLGIKVSPSSANKKVTWRSSNKRIATVDSNGKVTGVRKGSCTIYATSTTNSSKRDSVTIVVTDYVKYPDRITVTPQENAVYETGNTVLFTASLYPEDTTETDIIWKVSGGATINQNGLLAITDGGEITVKAYSSNQKTVGEYKFNAVYSEGHFIQVGGAYNLMNSRNIEMYFDTDLSAYSAMNSIFATSDAAGNGERIKLSVKTEGKKIIVAPAEFWPEGDVYIFIKGTLCDIHGNALGKNLKYKLNIRGNVNVK